MDSDPGHQQRNTGWPVTEILTCTQSCDCVLSAMAAEGGIVSLRNSWDLIVSLWFIYFVAVGIVKILQDDKVTDHIPLLGV